ncbi:MAG: nitroreductase family protein [Clostridia bacterium]|nr:nitroreductase family protein [Clostridia bacterium]
MDIIFNRRSVRRYIDKPVEDEKIDKMLRAAMQAPSAANQQPWEFIVVKDKDMLKRLSEISPYAKMTESAALAVVLLGNKYNMKFEEYWQQDMGAATQNLLLSAAYQDLGAVWLGVYPDKDRVDYIKELFDLPENVTAYGIVPVGYPDGQGNKFVDRYDESKVHYEKY